MSTGAAMDLLRKMNDQVDNDSGDAGAPENDGYKGTSPRVALAEAELESGLVQLAQAVGGFDRLTVGDLKGLMGHMYKRGHGVGHKRGFQRAERMKSTRYGRSRRMDEFREDIIDRYIDIHGGNIIQGDGYYFGTIEAQFGVEGTGASAECTAYILPANPQQPVIDKCFDYGIGDVSTTWLGNPSNVTGTTTNNGWAPQPHTLTAADTNLQNPGQNLYADEVFIIEGISARVRGAAVQYPIAGGVGTYLSAGPQALNALAGYNMVMDENGAVIPVELWNGLTDYYRLAHALAENSSLHFTWRDLALGGTQNTSDVLVDSFLHVPGSYEMSVKRTSGGNNECLDLPQGYIWCLDKQFQASRDEGGNGLFDCELHLDAPVAVPFAPLASVYGSVAAAAPAVIALYWEVRLIGTSLTPGKRSRRQSETRRRM